MRAMTRGNRDRPTSSAPLPARRRPGTYTLWRPVPPARDPEGRLASNACERLLESNELVAYGFFVLHQIGQPPLPRVHGRQYVNVDRPRSRVESAHRVDF